MVLDRRGNPVVQDSVGKTRLVPVDHDPFAALDGQL
jgi:hypothetical protein